MKTDNEDDGQKENASTETIMQSYKGDESHDTLRSHDESKKTRFLCKRIPVPR
jgi:hypothetical protein